MKQILFSLTFFFSVLTFAQKVSSEKNITELTLKIEQSQKGEKLRWLDSLSNYIAYDTNFENDSIVKETVLKALELDSLRIATRSAKQHGKTCRC